MKRSVILQETLKNISMLKHKDIERVIEAARTMLDEKPESKEEWMQKELSSMTHYFNEMDLEDEIHFVHETITE